MKYSVLLLVSLLVTAQAVPSKEAAYDRRMYSRNLHANKFVKEIKEDRGKHYEDLTSDPEFEAVADDDKHMYADFSGDTARNAGDMDNTHGYERYEDIVAKEIRVSGQSLETEGSDGQKPSYATGGNNDDADEKGSVRQLRTDASASNKGPRQVEDNLDKGTSSINDVQVMRQSGRVLRDLDAVKTVDAEKVAEEAIRDAVSHEQVEIERDETEPIVGGNSNKPEEAAVDDPNYGYRHGYDNIDDVTVKGQAIEHDIEEEIDADDYEDDDEADDVQRFDEDGGDEDGDDDDYSYDDDTDEETEEDDIDYSTADGGADANREVRVKGMTADRGEVDEDEPWDDDDEFDASEDTEEVEGPAEEDDFAYDDDFVDDDVVEDDFVEDDDFVDDDEYDAESEGAEGEFEDDADEEHGQLLDDETDNLDPEARDFEEDDSYDDLHGDDVEVDDDVKTDRRK